MAKISILLNLGLTIIRVGAGVGSRLSGFISGHNFWTLVSGGRYIRPYSRISSCLYLLLLMDICYHTMEFIYLSRVLRPLKIKGQPTHDRSHVAEHCTGNAKVVGSSPVQSLNWAAVASIRWSHVPLSPKSHHCSLLGFFWYQLYLENFYKGKSK